MRIEIRQLRYFVALSESNTFSRAADREHITQSALSQQVSRLERMLGVRLFERTAHGTRLTSAGEALLPQAQLVIREVDRFSAQADALGRNLGGLLIIGSPINAAMSARRQTILAQFGHRHPNVEMRIDSMWSNQIITRLRDNLLDTAFINLGLTAEDAASTSQLDGMEITLVQDGPAVIVAAANHPLASLSSVSLSDLAGHTVLSYPEVLNPWLFRDTACLIEAAGANIVILRESTPPGILAEVERGEAVFPAIAWEMASLNPPGLGGLVTRPTTGEPGLRYNLWLVRRKGENSASVNELYAIAQQPGSNPGNLEPR